MWFSSNPLVDIDPKIQTYNTSLVFLLNRKIWKRYWFAGQERWNKKISFEYERIYGQNCKQNKIYFSWKMWDRQIKCWGVILDMGGTCSSSYACFGCNFSRDPCDGFRLKLKWTLWKLFKTFLEFYLNFILVFCPFLKLGLLFCTGFYDFYDDGDDAHGFLLVISDSSSWY